MYQVQISNWIPGGIQIKHVDHSASSPESSSGFTSPPQFRAETPENCLFFSIKILNSDLFSFHPDNIPFSC